VNIIYLDKFRVIDEIDRDSGVALKVRKSEESPKLSIIDYALFTLRDAKVMGVCGIQMAPFAKTDLRKKNFRLCRNSALSAHCCRELCKK
jgi:hypothetical protein